MATFSGRNARVSVIDGETEVIVSEMATWSISSSAEEVDASVFGTQWAATEAGMLNWSATISGFADSTDQLGQKSISDAFLDGSLITVRFYLKWTEAGTDDTYYQGTCRVTGFNVSTEAKGIAKLDVNLSGSGSYSSITPAVSGG